MSLGLILTIVLIVLLLGALPTWPHSRNCERRNNHKGARIVAVGGVL
jgi:hypothetical protein